MGLLPLILLTAAGILGSQAKLVPSMEHVYLQPGELKAITLSWNGSRDCQVLLRAKLPYIASITPPTQAVTLDHDHFSWQIQVMGLQLGYTRVIAAINVSNVFSFEESLVKVTVLQSHWLQALSFACGWIYFSAWTFSFYPQILINMRRRSVVGLNFDFLALNELGYICYSIFNCCLYFVPSIQAEYFRRHSGATNPVLLNDVLFSVHGFVATTVMILQVFCYDRGGQSVSQTAVLLLTAGVSTLTALLLAAGQGYLVWLDAVLCVSFIKLLITITKYIPQAFMNYRNKSTEGWSIECVLCDLTGSCFSLLQMVLISYNCDDWVSIIGDPTKFCLGVFSIGFDLLFMVQHFILYRSPKNSKQQEEEKSYYNILRESMLDKLLWISDNSKR